MLNVTKKRMLGKKPFLPEKLYPEFINSFTSLIKIIKRYDFNPSTLAKFIVEKKLITTSEELLALIKLHQSLGVKLVENTSLQHYIKTEEHLLEIIAFNQEAASYLILNLSFRYADKPNHFFTKLYDSILKIMHLEVAKAATFSDTFNIIWKYSYSSSTMNKALKCVCEKIAKTESSGPASKGGDQTSRWSLSGFSTFISGVFTSNRENKSKEKTSNDTPHPHDAHTTCLEWLINKNPKAIGNLINTFDKFLRLAHSCGELGGGKKGQSALAKIINPALIRTKEQLAALLSLHKPTLSNYLIENHKEINFLQNDYNQQNRVTSQSLNALNLQGLIERKVAQPAYLSSLDDMSTEKEKLDCQQQLVEKIIFSIKDYVQFMCFGKGNYYDSHINLKSSATDNLIAKTTTRVDPDYFLFNSKSARSSLELPKERCVDFTTTSTNNNHIAVGLAHLLYQTWQKMCKAGDIREDEPFKVLECGGGSGILCRNILAAVSQMAKITEDKSWRNFWECLHYNLIEISSKLHEKQKETTYDFREKIKYVLGNALKLSRYFKEKSIHFMLSNELIDMLPTHQVRYEEDIKVAVVIPQLNQTECQRIKEDKIADLEDAQFFKLKEQLTEAFAESLHLKRDLQLMFPNLDIQDMKFIISKKTSKQLHTTNMQMGNKFNLITWSILYIDMKYFAEIAAFSQRNEFLVLTMKEGKPKLFNTGIYDFLYECQKIVKGVIYAADYFKDYTDPTGDADSFRTYYRGKADSDIFSHPGDFDITYSPNKQTYLQESVNLGLIIINNASEKQLISDLPEEMHTLLEKDKTKASFFTYILHKTPEIKAFAIEKAEAMETYLQIEKVAKIKLFKK